MAKSKRAQLRHLTGLVDWTGIQTQRFEYEPAATLFGQGDACPTVMYLEAGRVRLSVISHAGKEAVIAVLDPGHFFGEGCLAGQTLRMATASAMEPCSVLAIDKPEMVNNSLLGVLLRDS